MNFSHFFEDTANVYLALGSDRYGCCLWWTSKNKFLMLGGWFDSHVIYIVLFRGYNINGVEREIIMFAYHLSRRMNYRRNSILQLLSSLLQSNGESRRM